MRSCLLAFDAPGRTGRFVASSNVRVQIDTYAARARQNHHSRRHPNEGVARCISPYHHLTKRVHGRQEIEERGTDAIEFVRKAGGGCWAYGTKYTVGNVLTVVASVNVVVINFGLKASTRRGVVVRTGGFGPRDSHGVLTFFVVEPFGCA